MASLEQDFQAAVLDTIEEARRTLHYNPTRYRTMVNEHGAVEAVRRLLHSTAQTSEGLSTFWEKGRLDLSAEALALKPEFAPLFTDAERQRAREILADYKYTPPWDKPMAAPSRAPAAEAAPAAPQSAAAEAHSEAPIPLAVSAQRRPPLAPQLLRPDPRLEAELARLNAEPEDEPELPPPSSSVPLSEWLAQFTSQNPFVGKLAHDYPEWLQANLPRATKIVTHGERWLEVRVNNEPLGAVCFNKVWNSFVHLYKPAPEDIDLLNERLGEYNKLRTPTKSRPFYRFFVNSDNDYELLKKITRNMVKRVLAEQARAHGIPDTGRQALLEALGSFDRDKRNTTEWQGWMQDSRYQWAIQYEDRLYPVKEIVRMATGAADFDAGQARAYVGRYGFQVAPLPKADSHEADGRPWPDGYDAPAFVVVFAGDGDDQRYGETYSFGPLASGDRGALDMAVRAMQAGGPPVHLVLYRPTPRYAFTAWARVRQAHQTPRPEGGQRWVLDLEQYEFPVALDLKGNAGRLREEVEWLADLKRAFNYKAIRLIGADDFRRIIELAWELGGGLTPRLPPRRQPNLPHSLGERLRPYVELAAHLDGPSYTAQEIVGRLVRITPPIVALDAAPDAEALARDLVDLRLLERLTDGRYRRWAYLADATPEPMLRYSALTLVARDAAGQPYLPVEAAPWDQPTPDPQPAQAWPLDQRLLDWYAEAGLVRRGADGGWQVHPDALAPQPGDTATVRALNTFLAHLERVRAQRAAGRPALDGPLPHLPPATLDERIAEIQRELLVDRSTILRVYRSLVAGHHVILSGPPGTGKTHLARLLPRVLWRDPDVVSLTLPADPARPPTAPPIEHRQAREGYLTDVVTATEDWSVRHVIGGIAPRLLSDGDKPVLVYRVVHGHLTRAVLGNYAGYEGEGIPDTPTPQRVEVREHGTAYRGRWLVIDEFTRAPIDAAFGSLLTTLGGQRDAPLAVPTDEGGERPVPLPRDFRLIGTLNSFDRHFLNQMSEALKRRFTFIDLLPPSRHHANAEQAIAVYHALCRLAENGVPDVVVDADQGWASWEGGIDVQREPGSAEGGEEAYRLVVEDEVAQHPLRDFWRVFEAARVYRQFGTAQAVSVYTALLSGRLVGMDWSDALDTALADGLADQLQVLARDEQRALLAYLQFADRPEAFRNELAQILGALPLPRLRAHLYRLKLADPEAATDPLPEEDVKQLSGAHVGRAFSLGSPLVLPPNGLFARRLDALINERGL